MGFNVDDQFSGGRGFVTASHCDGGILTGPIGDTTFQNLVGSGNAIGVVDDNPAWNSTDPACGGYPYCTPGDVMYVRMLDTTSATWSKRVSYTTSIGIANGTGNQTINSWYSGLSQVPFVYTGLPLYKTGRSTGTTLGTVMATCTTYTSPSLSVPQYVLLCVDRVDSASVGKGDRGGAVWYPPSPGAPPYAVGILSSYEGSSYASDSVARCTAGCQY